KTRALINSIWDFEIHTVRNEPESLLLEGKLIKEFRPRYNVSFRDDKRFLLLKIHLEDPLPRIQLCRVRKEDGARYFGPFAHSGALRSTVNWMNRHFGLRSCRPIRPGEQDYKHCHDDVIKNCTAPCIGKITPEAYKERALAACSVLEGKSRDLLKTMEAEMAEAAAKLDFERAAELRDMLDNLRKTLGPTRRFTRKRGLPRENSEEALADVEDLQQALHLESPPLIMECFDISNISLTHCVASMVRFKNGLPDNRNYRRYRIRAVSGQDDFASMAEVVRRRYSRILLETRDRTPELLDSQETTLDSIRRVESIIAEAAPGEKNTKFVTLPDLVIVDGGKGQLSSALGELRRLGLQELPLIGLAKEHEEIYRPGIPDPLILPHDRGALKLLQRIRDEAHRFANGYHQLLMKRRVSESILDDCPGISERRKTALLKHFGSVARLKKASADEMASLRGISKNLADDILRFLDSHSD
ncbi:MAG: UvrB/UvrC motif-containing protein, partial [Verrucomicrobiota bacterium]